MVAEFNQNANTLGLAEKVTGYMADLLTEDAPAEAIDSACTNLDVLTISMALHHFEHPDRAIKSLGQRLKKDGVCFIIDLVPQAGDHGSEHEHNHGHHGHSHGHSHDHEHRHGHGNETEFPEAAHTIKTHGFSREAMQELFQGGGFNTGFDYQVLPEPLTIPIGGGTLSKTVFIARAQRA
jgi:SAM-dependent methyltransferase